MGEASELLDVIAWMAGDDTGISSLAIASAMAGIKQKTRWGSRTPRDPSDLGRCLRLMAKFPQWTPERFEATMSGISHEWRCFAEDWPQIAASMADEVGIDWSKGKSAPKTYELMKATERRAIETDPEITVTGRRDDGSIYAWERRRATPRHTRGRSTMSEKPVKLTEPQAALLRRLASTGSCIKPLSYRPAQLLVLAGYATTSTRGLLTSQKLTITDAGRAHPAATQGEAP